MGGGKKRREKAEMAETYRVPEREEPSKKGIKRKLQAPKKRKR